MGIYPDVVSVNRRALRRLFFELFRNRWYVRFGARSPENIRCEI